MYKLIAALSLAKAVLAQQVGNITAEKHPSMTWSTCDASGCQSQAGELVLDANWRWLHTTSGYDNCYDGNKWIAQYCPDGKTCATNCAVDGADYAGTYGITSPSDGAVQLQFVTKNTNGANVGSRLYLMASEDKYQMFNMLNKEIAFDVDVSNLPYVALTA